MDTSDIELHGRCLCEPRRNLVGAHEAHCPMLIVECACEDHVRECEKTYCPRKVGVSDEHE